MYLFIISPNFSAPIVWMGLFYGIELAILGLELLVVFNPKKTNHKLAAILGFLALIVGVMATSNLGFVFGSLTARPFYHGVYFPVFLVVSGIFRIVSALTLKFPGWGWQMLSGVVTMILGVLITKVLKQDDGAGGLWVIGLFVGIEMIFNGWTWIMLSLEVRSIPVEDAPPSAGASDQEQPS